jgi:hypothetical protein
MIISCSLPLLHCVQVVTYIERIILNGMAYVSQGSVYFDTNRFRYVHMCVLCCVWARVRVCVLLYCAMCAPSHQTRMPNVEEEPYAQFLCVSLSNSVHSCLCVGGTVCSLFVCESEQKCTQLLVCGRGCLLTLCVWVWAKVYTVACVWEELYAHFLCVSLSKSVHSCLCAGGAAFSLYVYVCILCMCVFILFMYVFVLFVCVCVCVCVCAKLVCAFMLGVCANTLCTWHCTSLRSSGHTYGKLKPWAVGSASLAGEVCLCVYPCVHFCVFLCVCMCRVGPNRMTVYTPFPRYAVYSVPYLKFLTVYDRIWTLVFAGGTPQPRVQFLAKAVFALFGP